MTDKISPLWQYEKMSEGLGIWWRISQKDEGGDYEHRADTGRESTAKIIVHRVNNYPKAIEACQRAKDWIKTAPGVKDIYGAKVILKYLDQFLAEQEKGK